MDSHKHQIIAVVLANGPVQRSLSVLNSPLLFTDIERGSASKGTGGKDPLVFLTCYSM